MALIDNVISPINTALTTNLSWLTNAFGKVQRLSEEKDGKKYRYPAAFIGGNTTDYRNLLPDGHLGNYCYWEVAEKQQYDNIDRHIRPIFDFKLVFWFDWRTIYPADWKGRSIEEIKAEILNVLVAAAFSRSVQSFEIDEDAESIYRGFTHKAEHRHFMMRPYGAIAISGTLVSSTDCNLSLMTPVIPPNISGLLPANYSLTEQVWPLSKWIGNKVIYWRTWEGDDAGVAIILAGLTSAGVERILRVEHTHRSSDATDTHFTPSSPVSVGLTQSHIEDADASTESHYVTIWYTKP